MATDKQKLAINKMVENGGYVMKAMKEVGYSPATIKTPKKLTESKGFKELCEQYGLTDKLLLKSLVADIKNKPKNRKPEMELGFKVLGRLSEKNDFNQTNVFVLPSEIIQKNEIVVDETSRNTKPSSS